MSVLGAFSALVIARGDRQARAMAIDIERILVPLDFSENTPALLEWASHLAEEHGSALVLLHAYHLPVEFQQLEGAYLPPDFWANVRSEAEEQLAAHAGPLRSRGLSVDTA